MTGRASDKYKRIQSKIGKAVTPYNPENPNASGGRRVRVDYSTGKPIRVIKQRTTAIQEPLATGED
jgi:hypothetical protein